MSNFYSKFALNNIKKNKKLLVPYMLSSIFTMTVFYILTSLATSSGLGKLSMGVQATKTVLQLGIFVIGIFSVIFLFYTYSFLIKRRVKEFGLYSVLGMTKKQIAKILVVETIYIAIVTIALGLIFGIIFDKLALLILLKMFGQSVSFGFSISIVGIILTVFLFSAIYGAILIYTIVKIARLKIVALLKEENTGEKEPKSKIVLTLLGLAFLGFGYFTALSVKDPVKAITMFFIAVVAVIIGTYLLFMAVSITVLKILKANKNFYYKPRNFISVSGLLYRMKRNAVGLANICILSTMVLVTMGSTSAMYFGMEKVANKTYPRDIAITTYQSDNAKKQQLQNNINQVLQETNTKKSDVISLDTVQALIDIEGNNFKLSDGASFKTDFSSIIVLTLDEYKNQIKTDVTLADDEILLYNDKNKYQESSLKLANKTFKIKEHLSSFDLEIGSLSVNIGTNYYIIVKNDSVRDSIASYIVDESAKSGVDLTPKTNYYMFNVSDKAKDKQIEEKLNILNNKDSIRIELKSEGTEIFKSIYSSFLFIGVFISLVFVVSQVVIMYYKQISEGYEDKERYEILRKVGISDGQIRQSIRGQVLLVFFAPLVVAVIHTLVALPFIEKIMQVLLLNDSKAFVIAMLTTAGVFTLFYFVVYKITSKTYYNIIK